MIYIDDNFLMVDDFAADFVDEKNDYLAIDEIPMKMMKPIVVDDDDKC